MRITSKESQNNLRQLESEESVLCLGCFKSLREYDVVKVITEVKEQPKIEIGDIGTILLIFNNGEAFEVENILNNGDTKWQSTLTRKQIKWVKASE